MLNLVTGGAGFLGSHLANALVDDGQSVLIIDDLSSGFVRNLEHAVSSGRATFIFGNVAAPRAEFLSLVESALVGRKLDRIWHLASPASPEAYGRFPLETLAVNGPGTLSLVELALSHDAMLLYASTSEIYGDPLLHPQPESYFGNVDPIGPRSCYDEGKRFGEATIAAAVRACGLRARIVRFFNCYGPKMGLSDGRLIPALIESILCGSPMPIHGTGDQTRSMTFVDDAIHLMRLVMDRQQSKLQPVNIGNNDERSVTEIAQTLASVAGVPFRPIFLPARDGDPQRRQPDLTVARALGWEPATSLDDGLRLTFQWFRKAQLAFA